jgi:Concanavalin A-like lectin/glucanases superfamily
LLFDDSGLREDAKQGAGGRGASGGAGGSGTAGAGGSGGTGSPFPGPRDTYGLLVIGDEPIAYYRFDEVVDDDTVISAVKGAPDGEIRGIATFLESGAVGASGDAALQFDEETSLSIDKSLGLAIDRGFAVEVWFSLNTNDLQEACLLSAGDDFDGGVLLTASVEPGLPTSLFADLFDEEGIGVGLDVELDSPPEGFTYLSLSFDGETLTLCVGEAGGSLSCRSENSFDLPLTPITSPEVLIGDSDILPGCTLNGVVDELAFYDRPLDENEAGAHYVAGSFGSVRR